MSRSTANSSSRTPRIISAVDERAVGRIAQRELHAAIELDDRDLELGMTAHDLAYVVVLGAAVEHRERAAPENVLQTALAAAAQPRDLALGEDLEAALGCDYRVHASFLGAGRAGVAAAAAADIGGEPGLRAGSRSACSLASSTRCRSCQHR
jgi:hypothetical protein